ncbi:MAG TPA: sigma-54-dependent Fis family transcriptional regulator [Deltaproteobacteria bacterium]|nr:sigma-54-dependent Fis family transcriptional regulator [Deltaproteobacteria bacterium]
MPTEGHRILIIDDELNICTRCVKILLKTGYAAQYALDGYEALKMVEERPFDLIITDLKMSSMGGMEVLRRVKDVHPDTMVIVITGYATVSSAVEVMKMGAFDYLPKPFTPDELRAVVHNALDAREAEIHNRILKERKGPSKPVTHQLVGSSPKIKTVINMVQKVAPTDSTVLIYGESGTGKELIARALHANSRRKEEVFFAVDCGALSANLIESELFGYEKGAFTGAHKNKDGIFKLAHRGTVFLDEISNVSLEIQGKLLRFLETREFLPLGAASVQKVDIRIILATNRDLKEMVEEGAFREDFYYRIYVYPISLPPLRERKSDILPIAYHFLEQFNRAMGKQVKGFDREAARQLSDYDWPGNVRQLRNIIERAVILCDAELISAGELSLTGKMDNLTEMVPSTNEGLKKLKKEVRQRAGDRVEKNFLLHALAQNDWNATRAAKNVGIQRTNFQNLLKKHAITRPRQIKP